MNLLTEGIFDQYKMDAPIQNYGVKEYRAELEKLTQTPNASIEDYVKLRNDVAESYWKAWQHSDSLTKAGAPQQEIAAINIKLFLLTKLQDKCQSYIDRIKKGNANEKNSQVKIQFAAYLASAPTHTIPTSSIPATISIPGSKGYFNNPYFVSGVTNQYAGDPAHYPDWSTPMKAILLAFIETLHQLGKPPLTDMYAGRYGGANINFAVFNPTKTLIWRKYDVGGGSGQNWLYINGTKVNTSHFMQKDQAGRQAMLSGV